MIIILKFNFADGNHTAGKAIENLRGITSRKARTMRHYSGVTR